MDKLLVPIPIERVDKAIFIVRGEKVILDSDLAKLYGVSTTRLNQQVKRNPDRFPNEFKFQLSKEEYQTLILQSATTKGRGGRRKLPNAFTEYGAIMAANVLNSDVAVRASVEVLKAFKRQREMLKSNAELAKKLSVLERKYNAQFKIVFDAIRQLMSPPRPPRKEIGFRSTPEKR